MPQYVNRFPVCFNIVRSCRRAALNLATVRGEPTREAFGSVSVLRRRSETAFERLVRARAVVCDLPEPGEQKSFTARCAVSGTDLSTWMVRQGWAKPNDAPEPALADAAEAAKSERIGLWQEPIMVR